MKRNMLYNLSMLAVSALLLLSVLAYRHTLNQIHTKAKMEIISRMDKIDSKIVKILENEGKKNGKLNKLIVQKKLLETLKSNRSSFESKFDEDYNSTFTGYLLPSSLSRSQEFDAFTNNYKNSIADNLDNAGVYYFTNNLDRASVVYDPSDTWGKYQEPLVKTHFRLFLALVGAIILFLVTILVIRQYKLAPARKEIALLRRQQNEDRKIKYYDYLRQNPLYNHYLCATCGWLGKIDEKAQGPTGLGGAVTAAGGTAVAGAGVFGTIAGVALIIIGIPLLFIFFIGIIPIAIGSILLTLGGTVTTSGVTIGVAGAQSMSEAAIVRAAIQASPHQCPKCQNMNVIPATSPMAEHIFTTNQVFHRQMQQEIQAVLAGIPPVIAEKSSTGTSK